MTADINALQMVSKSLQTMLESELKKAVPNSAIRATLQAPDQKSNITERVNLFLYKVQESPFHKNAEWQPQLPTSSELHRPPLTLNLFYVLTAYSQIDKPEGDSDAHAYLGEAMRILHENPVIPDKYLTSDLKIAKWTVHMALSPLNMDEISKVWSTFGTPYRPSVMYEVSIIPIASSPGHKTQNQPVDFVRPTISASYAPPTLLSAEPARGPVGTKIVIRGMHLTGWPATVTFGGQAIFEAKKLTKDAFDVQAPQRGPGLYQIRVEIADLCVQTYVFEITQK